MALKKTSLYDMHVKYKGKIVDFAGFLLPIQYEGIKEEHFAVREKVGIFDVSHMGEFHITGTKAIEFINYIVTNDISGLVNGQISYSPMCNSEGGTVDDVLIYRFNETHLMMVVNGANVEKDYEHISALKHGFDVKVDDQSQNISQIAIQGPKTIDILSKITDISLSEIKYYHFIEQINIKGMSCILSRTGYTGEDGFEIYLSNNDAVKMWELLLDEGRDYGIKPCGLGCRDTLRFEAGMPLFGNELADDINPIEAGLSYFVKLNKEVFIGKDALIAYKNHTSQRKLIGFELLEKGISRHGYPVENLEGAEIGHVTTGYLSPSLGKSIGSALIKNEGYKINDEIVIGIRNKKVKAKVISRKFLKK